MAKSMIVKAQRQLKRSRVVNVVNRWRPVVTCAVFNVLCMLPEYANEGQIPGVTKPARASSSEEVSVGNDRST